MSFIVALGALLFLMFVAYRGMSVILFAPIAALGAVLLTDPGAVPAMFTGKFMVAMVSFVQNYFPVFLLGAVFGKLIELSGFAKSIVAATVKILGAGQAMLAIVAVGCILTYGGVSLFVVVFAVYPFAAEMFRASNIPKRLIPGTIALGAFTATMDSFPGTPQIQNILPTSFFGTNAYAAPILGTIGGILILAIGMVYLEWRRRSAAAAGEGYGEGHINEPEVVDATHLPNPWIAISPLIIVGVVNWIFTNKLIPVFYQDGYSVAWITQGQPGVTVAKISSISAIWALEGALLVGILVVLVFSFQTIFAKFAEGTKSAIAGALLASMNTASEYGFGAVVAALPGFVVVRDGLAAIPDPLIREAVTVTSLAGITGSASGGMGIALAAMATNFKEMATAAHIPFEMLHRVASMASGGMDTLPHNGAVITLLMVTGLTHKTSYKDIFAITCIKTSMVFVVIGLYYLTGLV
ncbi:GntP family permease [Siculibacillus lacustris]|uniref:GntP family permease n=1 Tax=Siculibacillus lacustris TaxID=1549641 RepID=A0A4Q9VDC0_9HYPH|nr:GntP family permease [Siculibacillus lacustris]TBW32651.1 GntP family permease [Siculibacillus lacustris]